MKKNVSKLAVLTLVTAFGLTGCNQNKDDTKPGDDKQDVEKKELKSITLSQTSLTLEEDAKQEITLTIDQTGLKNNEIVVEWDTDNYEVATVLGVGLKRTIKGEGAGNAKLTVTVTDTVNNKKLTAECAITVTAKDRDIHVTSVALNEHELTLTMGSNPQKMLRAVVTPNNATNQSLTWTSSDPEVATVDNGLVTAVAGSLTGRTATITVKSDDDPTKLDTCVVTVIDTFVAVEKVVISSTDTAFETDSTTGSHKLTLQSGVKMSGKLDATALGANDSVATNPNVLWSVESGSDVVSVSSTGEVLVLKTIKYGEESKSAVVKATSVADPTKSDTCTIVVEPDIYRDDTIHVEDNGIDFAESTPSKLEVGKTVNVQIVFSNNTTYRDINFEVVSNTATGTTGEKTGDYSYSIKAGNVEGKFTLKATSTDNPNATVTKEFTVYDTITHVTSIELGDLAQYEDENHPLVIFTNSDELNLNASVSVLPEQAIDAEHPLDKTLKYETTSDCFSVTSDGKLDPIKEGRGRIIISSVQDPDVTKIIYVQVKGIVIKRIEVEHEKTLIVNDTEANSFTLNPKVYNGRDGEDDEHETTANVTYVSSNPDVATVDANGKVTAKSGGDAVITITSAVDTTISAVCNIKVLNFMPKVMTLSMPTNLTFFNSSSSAGTNTVDGMYQRTSLPNQVFFADANRHYKVGNQGDFEFRPVVGALDDQGRTDTNWLGEVNYKQTLFKDDVELTDSQAAEYAEFDGTSMKFKSGVKGNFKVEYEALPGDGYKLSNTINNLEFSFEVIDGYNVYNLAELSFFDNTNVHVNWTAYRAANHVEEVKVTDGLVLHGDINIDSDILPPEVVWTESEVNEYISQNASDFKDWMIATGYIGESDTPSEEVKAKAKQALVNSPMDGTRIFSRQFVEDYDSDFAVEGNLFNIDASTIKQIVKEGRNQSDTLIDFVGSYGSEAELFAINYEGYDPASGKDCIFRNLSLLGNGGIANKDLIGVNLAKGGLIGIKVSGVHFKTENVLMKSWFTGMQLEQHNPEQDNPEITQFNIEKTIGTDFYNSAIYFWQAQNVTIKDSAFSNACGPLMLMDEVNRGNNDANPNFRPCEGTAINCYLDNELTGAEPWFVNHRSAAGDPTQLVQEMIAAMGKTTGFVGGYAAATGGKTITKTKDDKDFINMLVIDINADHFGDNYYQALHGTFTIKDDSDNIIGGINMNAVAKMDVGGGINAVILGGNPVVSPFIGMSPTGGYGYVDYSTNTPAPIYSDDGLFAKGDYMAYYMDPGLAIMQTTNFHCIGALLKTY